MDLGSKGKTPRVGARLKALDEAVLMAVSDFSCNFFCILSSRFEQCVFVLMMGAKTGFCQNCPKMDILSPKNHKQPKNFKNLCFFRPP